MTSITTTHAAAVEVADFAVTGLDASERIGQAIDRPRAKKLRRTLVVLGLGGVAAATYAEPSIWPRLWASITPAAAALLEAARTPPHATALPPQGQEPARTAATEPPPAPLTVAAKAPEPSAAIEPPQGEPSAPVATAPPVLPPPAPAAKSAKPTEPAKPSGDAYTAPKGLPADPVVKRAEAAGLHPDLSPALLKRLSDADFASAKVAIGHALKETGDTETLIWPQKAAKGATRFRISFVQGAPEGCRRYVVEIAKDGWQTTALPVETCGVRKLAAKRG